MAVVKTTSLRFYTFVFVGFLLVVLNVTNGQTTASSSSMTETPSTFHALPRTMIPVTGYGHFNVSNCILLDVSCSVSVDLHVGKEVQAVSYDLPTNAVPSGNCTSKTSSITLTWTHKGTTHLWLTMTIENGDTKWETSKLGFRATAVNQSSLVTNGTEREVNAWQNDTSKLKMAAGSGKSFKCGQNLDITLQGNVKVTVTIKKIQLQPFGGEGDASFGEADFCFVNSGGKHADPVDTIVPTAVGCVLAGLVVILIITYFVGRCKRPGYERM